MKSNISNVLSIVVLCLFIQICKAQRPIAVNNNCPNPSGGRKAFFTVRFFLNVYDLQNARVEMGATNETIEQIRPVSDGVVCSALNEIVRNNPKFRLIEDNLKPDRTKYYYRTENFFYIFWDKKPEFDNIPNTGPNKIFVVVSADYQNIWEFYL